MGGGPREDESWSVTLLNPQTGHSDSGAAVPSVGPPGSTSAFYSALEQARGPVTGQSPRAARVRSGLGRTGLGLLGGRIRALPIRCSTGRHPRSLAAFWSRRVRTPGRFLPVPLAGSPGSTPSPARRSTGRHPQFTPRLPSARVCARGRVPPRPVRRFTGHNPLAQPSVRGGRLVSSALLSRPARRVDPCAGLVLPACRGVPARRPIGWATGGAPSSSPSPSFPSLSFSPHFSLSLSPLPSPPSFLPAAPASWPGTVGPSVGAPGHRGSLPHPSGCPPASPPVRRSPCVLVWVASRAAGGRLLDPGWR